MFYLLIFVFLGHLPALMICGNIPSAPSDGSDSYHNQIEDYPNKETIVRYIQEGANGNDYQYYHQQQQYHQGPSDLPPTGWSNAGNEPQYHQVAIDRALLSQGYPQTVPSGPSPSYSGAFGHQFPTDIHTNSVPYGHHQAPASAPADPTGPSEQVDVINYVPVPVVKKVHVPFRTPVRIPISHAVVIPIPKPVPIHIPVPQQVQVPVEKELKIPVERVVPYPVEKSVPVPVEKHVPYPVIKYVPVRVHKPYPIKVPVVKTVVHKVRGWW